MAPHRKRCRRFDVVGDVHCLTFSCYRRLPLLSRDRTRQWLVRGIDRARISHPFDLWAWAIMPEHVHLLLLPAPTTQISQVLKAIKQSVARTAVAWLQKHRPDYLPQLADVQPSGMIARRFWQRGGGYDRNLRSVRDIHEKLRYIHDNPVRRKLVTHPLDWAWSSAAAGRSMLVR